MKIKNYLTTRNFTASSNRKINFIVIHYVGAVSTALANAKYFHSKYIGASAHYFVDENDIYRVVEDKNIAWHCGAKKYKNIACRNSNSIGIEMCCFKKNGKIDVSENVENRTVELTKMLMEKYNISVNNVVRHYDVTGKNCPAPFVSSKNRWNNFKNKLVSNNNNNSDDSDSKYYPQVDKSYVSIVDALKSINVDSSFKNRKLIAQKNNVRDYTGTYNQNSQLLEKLKAGRLLR